MKDGPASRAFSLSASSVRWGAKIACFTFMLQPIASREQLLHLLTEAAELEHNLLCSYLFALFSLKSDRNEDLLAGEFDAVQRWRKALLGVCVEEMTHLAQIANLATALGVRPHFNRPNLPVAAGYHPAAVVVRLTRFDLDTLDHFIHLERPEGIDVPDGQSFRPDTPYVRSPPNGQLMPSAPDYDTIGAFYDVLRQGLVRCAGSLGEGKLFMGPIDVQLRPDEIGSEALKVITGLASACEAIDEIVRQGEGSPGDVEGSHFSQFVNIRTEYQELLEHRSAFDPSRNVAPNPVMRQPVTPNRTHVTAARASAVLDASNAIYSLMLRCLAQCYETPASEETFRAAMVGAAFKSMRAFAGIAADLTQFSARDEKPNSMAGVTFAMLRATEGPAHGMDGWVRISERLNEIRADASSLPLPAAALERLQLDLARVGEALARGRSVAGG